MTGAWVTAGKVALGFGVVAVVASWLAVVAAAAVFLLVAFGVTTTAPMVLVLA